MSPFRSHTLAAVLAVSAVAAAAPSTAAAADSTCTATAVSGTVLGAAAGSPATSPTPCAAGTQDYRAGSLSSLQPELPQIAVPAGLGALPVPLPASAALLGLPSSLTVDATGAARQLVEERKLPDVSMLAADLVRTGVGAACQAGNLVFSALSDVQNLRVLGQSLPSDGTVDTAVPLADAETVDFSQIDVAAIALPGGLSLANPVTGPVLRAALKSAVAALPKVSVPAAVAQVVVEPAHADGTETSHRQIGPRVRISALGRELADVTLGDVLLDALGTVCTADVPLPAAPPVAPEVSPATELALSCANADVTLTDVVEKDGKVKLVGVAAPRFVGRSIDLVLTATGQKVATALVQPDGYFRARAPLPAQKIRFTNAARYQAVVDGEKSRALKLHRRMRISRMQPIGDTITIVGKIYGVRADDEVAIARREGCTKDIEVITVKPERSGHFRVTLRVPAGVDAATYRATTQVRGSEGGRSFRTFSLPGFVALGQ